jgi:predicted metal-dependent peptidase
MVRLVDKVVKARSGLLLDNPFFGTILLKLGCAPDPNCETAWTDGVTVGYNPEFTESLTIEEVRGLLAHEALHYMMKHHLRRGERDPGKWNMAADYVINNILVDAGFKIPEGGLIGPQYKDMSAEKVYELLPKGDKDSGGSGSDDQPGWNWGEVRDQTKKDPSTGKQKPMSKADMSKADGEVNIAISQAVTAGKRAGNMPAGLSRLVDEILEPKVNWRTELQRFVQAFAKNDYSFRKPDTSYRIRNMYVPSLFSEEVGPIVSANDTSISISNEQLRQALCGELIAIKETVHPEKIVVMYCDTQVYSEATQEFYPYDDIILEPKGGGGTRFSPVFEEVEHLGLEPVCLIYSTDGYCNDFPSEPPDYPVLWLLTEDNRSFDPPFGEIIYTT